MRVIVKIEAEVETDGSLEYCTEKVDTLLAFGTICDAFTEAGIDLKEIEVVEGSHEKGDGTMKKKGIDEWLDSVSVSEKAQHDAKNVPWWPDSFPWGFEVDDGRGVIALFVSEADAFRFRLDYINRKMNP